MPVGGNVRFREVRDQLVDLDGYTAGIGEDLMIEGVDEVAVAEGDVAPSLNLTVARTGYSITVKASLQGMDALQVEYKPNGGSWGIPKFFTKLPATFTIAPQTSGQSESDHVRARLIDENEPRGNYSPEYPVTVAP